MPFEVELKARLTDPAALEKRAAELGLFLMESTKADVYFRRKGDSRVAPTDRYRLRQEGHQNIVTFKDKQQVDGLEVNDEVEFTIDDVSAFYRFVDRLGFEPFVAKQKRSRVYEVGRAHIEINHVKYLGDFVEIEILCQTEAEVEAARRQITHLLRQLGLSQADLEPRRYIDMIQKAHPARYRLLDGELVEELI